MKAKRGSSEPLYFFKEEGYKVMDNTFTVAAMTAPKFRVYNTQKYCIGVTTNEGRQYNIRPGSFALLSADDIEFIESIGQRKKFFGSGMLEVRDGTGKKIPLDQLNIVESDESEKVLSEDEITDALKKPLKTFTAWIEKIKDPVELHAIYMVASSMDLPSSKLKVLNAKMPNKDWLDELS